MGRDEFRPHDGVLCDADHGVGRAYREHLVHLRPGQEGDPAARQLRQDPHRAGRLRHHLHRGLGLHVLIEVRT